MSESSSRGPIGQNPEYGMCYPARSPGTLGLQDRADPNVEEVVAGDTPGPLGTGNDLACYEDDISYATESPSQNKLTSLVLDIDIERVEAFLYSVAHMNVMKNRTRISGLIDKEVVLPEPAVVATEATKQADRLIDEFYKQATLGPETVMSYLERCQRDRDADRAALDRQFKDVQSSHRALVDTFGAMIKGAAIIQFGSTATVKVLTFFTGPAGAVVDIGMEMAQEGIEKKATSAVISKGLEEVGKEFVELVNEAAGDKLLSNKEKELAKKMFKRYRHDAKKLQENFKWLEKRLETELTKGKKGKKLVRRYRRRLANLPGKTALLRKSAGKALAKKAVGRTFSIAFVAADLKEAWAKMNTTMSAAD